MKPRHTDIFPLTLPFDQPPPIYKTTHENLRTPVYGLCWVCTPRQLIELSAGEDPDDAVCFRWGDLATKLPYRLQPQIIYAEDGNNYLVAMFNEHYTEHQKRVADPEDVLMVAAKKAFAITPDLEPSFMWYRFPLGWVRDHAALLSITIMARKLPPHTDVFPLMLPFDQPPPVHKTAHENLRTPVYGLCWVCTPRRFLESAGGRDPDDAICFRWNAVSDLPYKFMPGAVLAGDGNYYLVAMYNDDYTEHQKRVADPEDHLIVAAQMAFVITPDLEPTFMWYRFPLGWVSD